MGHIVWIGFAPSAHRFILCLQIAELLMGIFVELDVEPEVSLIFRGLHEAVGRA